MTIEHGRNPRETILRFGNDSSGITIRLSRVGLGVTGHYDHIVGIEGGFIPWWEFHEYKRAADKSWKQLEEDWLTEESKS